MKKLIILLTVSAFLSMSCATQGAYIQYLDAKKAQISAERKPLIELSLDKDGKLASLAVYPAPQQIDIQQERDHPGYAVVSGLIKVVGVVGSIFVAGEAIEGIVSASTGTNTNINSLNNNSENAGTIDQGYTITDTVTDNSSQ